jgi:hypothetical protein
MTTTTLYPAHPCPETSPWGKVEDGHQIAPGIWGVSSSNHGGMWLSPERRERMPACLAQCTWLGSVEWYEEDIDGAWVVLAFPKDFDTDDFRHARFMIEGLPNFYRNQPERAKAARDALDLLIPRLLEA